MSETEEKIVIGHRGSRGLEPENTIPAFIKALKLGARGLEMDLYLTKDLKVVITHDATISASLCRTPEGEPLAEEEGKRMRIFGLDFKEIKPFDCGSEPNPEFPEQENTEAHIPRLMEVVKAIKRQTEAEKEIFYFLELKSDPATDNIYHPEPSDYVKKVLEVIDELEIHNQTLLMSFDKRCLKEVKKQRPEISTGLSLEEEGEVQLHIDELGFLPNAIFPYYKIVNAGFLGYCKVKGLKIYPWTVNEEKDMRKMLSMDINGLITDYPDKALELMNGKE